MPTDGMKQKFLEKEEDEAVSPTRKRPRVDDLDPSLECQPPMIRIRQGHDLFEQSEDQDPSQTTMQPDLPPPPTTKIEMEEDDPDLCDPRPSTSRKAMINSSADESVVTDPTHLRNYLLTKSLPNPLFGKTSPEKKAPEGQEVKASEEGRKVKVAKVAHYNARDDQGETQYVAEHQAKKHHSYIDDHSKRGNDEDEDTDGEDEKIEGNRPENFISSNNALGRLSRSEKVYSKYDFKTRAIDMRDLAVNLSKEMILKAIQNHRVVIIEGFTGCGKTTQVPQFILDQHYERGIACNIVVTQPRKIAAISVAKRVCDERNWKLGDVVGYQVGMDTMKSNADTLLTYVTTGVLLQKLIGARTFKTLTHVIIDEVHERDLDSDFLLLVIKKILQDDFEGKERHVKLILMSATLDAKKFSEYFPIRTGQFKVEESPIIKIPHTLQHNVEELFLDHILASNPFMLGSFDSTMSLENATIPEEMYTIAVDCIVSLDQTDQLTTSDVHDRNGNDLVRHRGSVLVFLPGMEEINRLFRTLTAKNAADLEKAIAENPNYKEQDYYQWDIVPLHSSVTLEEQQKRFQRPKDYFRKVILATNIAESSLTMPDVKYVIDFCLTKSLCIDPYTNFTTLRMVWASLSQCIQRKGRTGRVSDGKVFRLVRKSFFRKLPHGLKPEMLRSNLETVVLQLKKFNLGTPQELLHMALDSPPTSGIERAVSNLKELGALTIFTTLPYDQGQHYDTCDGDLTFLGSIMTELPISLQCTRLIMLGHCFGVIREAIIIAAALSVRNPFSTPFSGSLGAHLSRLNWSKESCSDLFALFHVYKHWIKQFAENSDANVVNQGRRNRNTHNERQWARGAFVQLSVLRDIKSTVELIEQRLRYRRVHLTGNPIHAEANSAGLGKEEGIMLKLAIAGAFYPNYFHRRRPELKTYEKEKSKEVNELDICNTVYFKGFPREHDGKIYAKFVADYLSFGLNVPSIIFDGQKVLATFDNRGEKIGPINKGVYRAIKRRQIYEMLEFPVAPRELEEQIMKDWKRELGKRRFNPCPPQVGLPGVEVSRISVRITHVENPGQFWITSIKNAKILDEMGERINDEVLHIPIHGTKLAANALCLASYRGKYYRAKILHVYPYPMDESLVYFIDFGNMAWLKNSILKDFTPSMIEKGYDTIPCLAVECRLSNIKPAKILGAVWHDTAKLEFQMFADNAPSLYIDIYSVSSSVIAGRLIGQEDWTAEQTLNDRLVNLGFAEVTDETTASQYNHRARMCTTFQDSSERAAHNKDQIGQQLDFDFVQSNLDSFNLPTTVLKGPWSPLELDFHPLCQSSSTKRVRVDSSSVNSVVLDTEPTAPISRLLVAANITIDDRSGSVVARDTTIMPPVPGFLPLMAMLFSPQMELRVDIRQTKYTGMICGLGSSPHQPDQSAYFDHDVEIVFDTCLDDDDIDSGNRIRYLMNLILRQETNHRGVVNLSHYQTSVREELLNLLRRPRNSVEEVWPREEYAWNCIDQNSLIPPTRNTFISSPKEIFAPHHKVKLRNDAAGSCGWAYAV